MDSCTIETMDQKTCYFSISNQFYLQDIWIYDSKIVLNLKNESDGSDPWKSQSTKIYPVKKPVDEFTNENTGDLTSEENIDTEETGSFDELTEEPEQETVVMANFTDTVQKWISPSKSTEDEV